MVSQQLALSSCPDTLKVDGVGGVKAIHLPALNLA